MNASYTGRMLLEDARRLTVDAFHAEDAADLIASLDRHGEDPDSPRLVRRLREKGVRDRELARRLKLVAMQLEDPSERHHVHRLDEVLAAYADEQAATLDAMGNGA